MTEEITPLSKKYQRYSNDLLNLDKNEQKKYLHKDKDWGKGYATFFFEEDVKLAVQGALKELRENYWNRKIQKKKEDRTAYWIYNILTKYFGDLAKEEAER